VRAAAPIALGVLVLWAPSAHAELRTFTYRQGPLSVGPYQVRYTDKSTRRVPSPDMDGFVVRMHARVVDKAGNRIPVRRLMLHHVVYKNHGRFAGDRRSPYCGGDSESFYGTGEENQTMRLPPGYGYRIRRGDRWETGWMLMNHRNRVDRAYIEYTATIDTNPALTPVTPYWLRVTGCPSASKLDPIFDVPGGGRRGSTYTKTLRFRLAGAGRLIAAGGHAHGGTKDLTITQPRCGHRTLMDSKPLFGLPSDPYYHVLPVLHEPGPIDMSWVSTRAGIPVGAGEPLELKSHYDAELPHTRVMGIMHLYVARDPSVRSSCARLPRDLRNERLDEPGRRKPPRVRVPLTGLDRAGRAHTISHPPGRRRRMERGATIVVRDFSFSLRNLSVPAGSEVRWRFRARERHNVTLANGPLGFSSQNLRNHRTYSRRLRRPGTYRIYCSLHPVTMTQAIVVRRRR
jgi:plastocyanin